MNIQDDKQYTIYEKEVNGTKFYRLQMSKKLQDGSYQNGYVDIKFCKCEPPKNKERIYLKNAFWSFYLNKDKHTIPYIVCMEYQTTEQVITESKTEPITEVKEKDPFEEFAEETGDDLELPF